MKISLGCENSNYFIKTTNNKGLNECKAFVESKEVGERILELHQKYFGKKVQYNNRISRVSNIGIVSNQELLYTKDGWQKETDCKLI